MNCETRDLKLQGSMVLKLPSGPRVPTYLLLSRAATRGMRGFAALNPSISGEDTIGNLQVTFVPFYQGF